MADRAQFAIDIAAQIQGADKTTSEIDALAREIVGAGTNIEDFERAAIALRQQLTGAEAAAKASAEALSDGTKRYSQAEKAADKMAKAVEKAALANGGVVPVEMVAELDRVKGALDDETAALAKLQRAAAETAGEQKRLTTHLKDLDKVQRAAGSALGEGLGKNIGKVKGALGDLPGPLGAIGEKLLFPVEGFNDLSESLGRSNAVALTATIGIAAVAAAVLAVGVAAIAGLANVTAWGVGLADQRREAELSQQAFNQLYPEMAGVSDQFAALTNATGVSSDRLREISGDLEKAKVSAEDLPTALKAAATAEAALGKGGSKEFTDNLKGNLDAVNDLAAEIDTKFGGIAAKRMLGLTAQSERFGRVTGETFGGLNIDPLLQGLSKLIDMFDANTVAGKAMKFLFESIFQPIVDGVAAAIPYVEGFVLGMLIGFTKVYIALKPVIATVKEFLGFNDPETAETFDTVKVAGEYLAKTIAVLVGVFGLALAAVVAVPVALVALGVEFWNLAGAIMGGIGEAVEWLSNVDLYEMGANMLRGLANGITDTVGAVVDSIVGAVSSAVDAAEQFLGIASPSKRMQQTGRFTGQGFTAGVEAEADNAHDAIANLVAPPPANDNGKRLVDLARPAPEKPRSPLEQTTGFAPPPAGGASAATGGTSAAGGAAGAGLSITGPFNFYGVKDAEHSKEMIEEALIALLEGKVLQAGGTTAADEEAA